MSPAVCAGLVQQQTGGGRGVGYLCQHARATCTQCGKKPNNKGEKGVQVRREHECSEQYDAATKEVDDLQVHTADILGWEANTAKRQGLHSGLEGGWN